MKPCNCNLSYANTSSGSCQNLMAVARALILVPTYDSTGARNYIAAGATINDAYFTAAINNTDATKRWYPLGLIDNVEDVRAEPVYETLNSGKKVYIQDGIRTFTAYMVEKSNILIDKLNNFQCKDFSVYIVDKEGSIIGSFDGTNLNPIMADKDTFYVGLVKTTDTTSQKLMVSFEFHPSEKDSDLRTITASEMNGANALLLEGLLDVNSAESSLSVNGFVLTLTTDYGTFLTDIAVTGWEATDFTLYNLTDDPTRSSALAKTVTETGTTGVYTFIYDVAQTSADVIEIQASKNGYEFTTTTTTVP